MAHIYTVLDIGSSKIAAVIASSNSDKPRILGFHSAPSMGVKKGHIVDIEQVCEVVSEVVEKSQRMAGQKIKNVFVTVGGPHITSQVSHGIVAVQNSQRIVQSDVERVVDAAQAISIDSSREILHVAPRSYTIDGQDEIVKPVGMSGVRLEVDCTIVEGSKTNLRNIEQVLHELGIRVTDYVYAGIASASVVLTETEKELGVALVDIGGGKTDIAVYMEGALMYCASLPIGGKHVTQDIAMGTHLDYVLAEQLKFFLGAKQQPFSRGFKQRMVELPDIHEFPHLPEGFDLSAKDVFEGVITARLEEIMNLVHDVLKDSGYASQIPAGIVLTGGGALCVGAPEMAKKVSHLPTRVGAPQDCVTGLSDDLLKPVYSATLGTLVTSIAEEHDMGSGRGSDFDFHSPLRGLSLPSFGSGRIKKFINQLLP